METKKWLGIVILSCVVLAQPDLTPQVQGIRKLTANEAKDHIGEQATVCGKVASIRCAATTREMPGPDTARIKNTIPEFV